MSVRVPKRKTLGLDQATEYLIDYTKAAASDEIGTGYGTSSTVGRFTHRLKIPVGTDKYPNPP